MTSRADDPALRASTSSTTSRSRTSPRCGPTATCRPTRWPLLLKDGQVWVSTTKDRKKYRNLVADDRITVCVVHRNNPNRYVEIRGAAELVDDPDRTVIDEIARVYMGVGSVSVRRSLVRSASR